MITKTRGLDVARLSLKDALDLAVLIEQEAQERYEELAHQMETHDSEEPARFFRFMALNEKKHGADLAARRHELFGDEPRHVTGAMLFDIEAPDYDEARAFMSPRDAMQVALRSEQKAHAFFVSVLPHLQNAEVKALFDELCAEELHHEALVARELASHPPTNELDAGTFADDPVAL